MSKDNMQTARRGYELFAAGDLEGASALFAPDAEVGDSGGLGVAGTVAGTRHGPEVFVRSTKETLDAFEDYAVEAEEFIDAGEAVVVSVRISGRGRTSGANMEMRLAHLWVYDSNGKVVLGEVYRNVEEVLEAVGRRQ